MLGRILIVTLTIAELPRDGALITLSRSPINDPSQSARFLCASNKRVSGCQSICRAPNQRGSLDRKISTPENKTGEQSHPYCCRISDLITRSERVLFDRTVMICAPKFCLREVGRA
ncbi:hypothetical protein J6590_010744 [Homalodisca vitripennis]|nr:hypothetical protein J6590_010744 [Homalodisca vitripennis]